MLPAKRFELTKPESSPESIMHEWSLYLVVGILGALIGSFLNV
jgi:hypothetical protein